ncbi:unnamed protein product [Linum trigynum]|uniref:rhamnogalacturonan endolyase n=1 Tax=Linum trigynum TaxID=586398 RepID=A0AAV2D575_9ROSI
MKNSESFCPFYVVLCLLNIGLQLAGVFGRSDGPVPGGGVDASGGVKLTCDPKHVTIDNGIIQLTLASPIGRIVGLKYHGADNLLDSHEPKLWGAYFDVSYNVIPPRSGAGGLHRVEATKYAVITEKPDIVEVSFSAEWNPSLTDSVVPLNFDIRYIVRKGDSGFYTYVAVERLKDWPDMDMSLHVFVFRPNKQLFNYMAVSDEIQLVMPTEADRANGVTLAPREAVLMTNPVDPAFKGQVDDKYEYIQEQKDSKLKGWISDTSKIGFWLIQPSTEYMNGGPLKYDLSCHNGPTCVMVFTGEHVYGDDVDMVFKKGEGWNKVFGPFFTYVNSEQDRAGLWKDAKSQLEKETQLWPYCFIQHKDYTPAAQRGSVVGQLLVDDKYLSPTPKEACKAMVGLAAPGTTNEAWQSEAKGYNFWTEADEKGNFCIKNVRPGDYNLYGFVPGIVGSLRHPQLITVKPGNEINLGQVMFKPPRNGPTVWELGIPNRSAKEFFIPNPDPKALNKFWLDKPDQKFRQWGLWDRYPVYWPKEDVVFEVGRSNYSKDWCFAHFYRSDGKVWNPTTWQIIFDLPEVCTTGSYTIHIALAAAELTNTLVYVNNINARREHYDTGTWGDDNAIARHGDHGFYRFFSGSLPSNLFVKGKNTIYLKQARSQTYMFAGVMYDYIRLEAPPPSTAQPKEL